MRTKIQRFTAAGLAVVLAISLVVQVFAVTQEPAPNMALLDKIIYGERKWVWDTLVADDRDTNPIAILMGTEERKSMAQEAIHKYYGIDAESEVYAKIYLIGVAVFSLAYSPEDVVRDWVDEAGNLLPSIAEYFSGPAQLQQFLDDLTTSTDELNYDKILKATFSEEYTSSTGFSLGDTEASYIFLQGLKDSLDMLSSAADVLRSDSGIGEDPVLLKNKYINEYALPLQTATEEFLNEFSKLLGTEDNIDCKRIAALGSTLATISYYQQKKPLYDYSYQLIPYNQQMLEGMVDKETGDLLKKAGKVLDFASTSLDTYIYIQSIKNQRDVLTGPISRLTDFSSNPDMKKSVDNYNDLINTELDGKVIAYESFVTFLREQDVVSDAATDLVKSLFKKTNLYKNSLLSTASIASGLSAIEIALWLGDKITGLEDTCKKTALLLRWDEIIDAAVQSYKQSERTYMNNRSEENAKKAIEDLMLLQRLRLYGEKIAYELTAGQFESWFGQIFCGQVTSDQWKAEYQRNVDILLAASPVPPMSGLEIQSGEQALLRTDDTVGLYISTDKGYIVDAATLLVGGITCNGGTLYVGDQITHLGTLQTSQNSNLLCASNTFFEDFYVKDGTTNVTVGSGGSMTIGNMTLHGAITGSSVHVNGSIDASGGGRATALKLIGPNRHTVSGSLTASAFYMETGPVDLQGNVTVTSELCGPDAEITNPENMLLSGGTVVGGSYPELLRVQNAKLADTEFEDQLKDLGGTTYSGTVTVEGAYSGQGASNIAENGLVDCRSDAIFTNMTLNGTGSMNLHGDVNLDGVNAEAELCCCGTFPQQVSGAAAVRDITIDNAHKNGVTLSDTITITGELNHLNGTIHGSKNLTLIDSAVVVADTFAHDLSFGDWTGSKPLSVEGSVYVSGTAMNHAGLIVGGDFVSSADSIQFNDCQMEITGRMTGVLTLQNSDLHIGGLQTSGPLSIDENSSLIIDGYASIVGTVLTDGPLNVGGDCILSGASVTGAQPLQCGGDLAVSGTTTVHHLQLFSSLPQSVSGEFTVNTLELKNSSSSGVTIANDITVVNQYQNHDTQVTGAIHVVHQGTVEMPGVKTEWSNVTLEQDTHVLGDLYLTGDLVLNGVSLVVDGDLIWTGGNLSMTDSDISVDGRLSRSGAGSGTITIDAGSSFFVRGAAQLQNLTIALDGLLYLGSDAITSSAPISGGGTLRLRGDFQSGSAVTLTGNLELVGKLPQNVLGNGAIHVGNVTLDNSSKTGITLTNAVYYNGLLEMGDTVITGSDKLIKEEA